MKTLEYRVDQSPGNFHEYAINSNSKVIFNKLSGALILVDSKWWDHLSLDRFAGINRSEPDGISSQEFETLKDLGFALNGLRFKKFADKIRQFGEDKKKTRPITFFITPQLTCPMGCVYCFEENDRKKHGAKRLLVKDISAIHNTIDKYKQLTGLSSDHIAIAFFGGEPLISNLREFNVALFELAQEEKFFVDVITSGVSIDDLYHVLLAKNKNIIREVNVTLDGPKEVHDAVRPLRNGAPSYDLIKENIQKMLDNGLRVLVKQNFGSKTINGFEKFIDDLVDYGWYDSPVFVHGVNMVKSYGGVDSGNQEIDETTANLRIIETFRKPKYAKLLPKFRLEGMKLIEYFSHVLHLLTFKNVNGKIMNKYDGYPRYAHCHPSDGTTINISYNGNICSCNWFQGKDLNFGNIFSKPDFEGMAKMHNVNVIDNFHCSACDIATTCGGGCLNDQYEMGKPAYYRECRKQAYEIQQRFLGSIFRKGWADAKLDGKKFKILSTSFDFDYQYENRILLQPSG